MSAVVQKQLLDHDMFRGKKGNEAWHRWERRLGLLSIDGVLLVSLIFLPSPLKVLKGWLVKGWPYPLVRVGATGISMRAPSGRL